MSKVKNFFLGLRERGERLLFGMENGVTKYHYLVIAIFAGFCLGVCPVFGFVVGLNYEKAKEKKADLGFAMLLIGAAVLGHLIDVYIVL